jgi:hypothetical protein
MSGKGGGAVPHLGGAHPACDRPGWAAERDEAFFRRQGVEKLVVLLQGPDVPAAHELRSVGRDLEHLVVIDHIGQAILTKGQAGELHVAVDGPEGGNVFRLRALNSEVSVNLFHGSRRSWQQAAGRGFDRTRNRKVRGSDKEAAGIEDSSGGKRLTAQP